MFAFYGKLKSFSAIAGMTALQSHISAWQITLATMVTSPPSRLRRPGPQETQGNRNAQPSPAPPRYVRCDDRQPGCNARGSMNTNSF
jgi:hypothetical protein